MKTPNTIKQSFRSPRFKPQQNMGTRVYTHKKQKSMSRQSLKVLVNF